MEMTQTPLIGNPYTVLLGHPVLAGSRSARLRSTQLLIRLHLRLSDSAGVVVGAQSFFVTGR